MEQLAERSRVSDLTGVECVVGLCVAALILWIARRRRLSIEPNVATKAKAEDSNRTTAGEEETEAKAKAEATEEKKGDLIKTDRSKIVPEDKDEATGLLRRRVSRSESAADTPEGSGVSHVKALVPEDQPKDSAPIVNADDGEQNVDNLEADNEFSITDEERRRAMALAAQLATQMGPDASMSDSVMAMSAFMVLETPPAKGEEERMRMEDPSISDLSEAVYEHEAIPEDVAEEDVTPEADGKQADQEEAPNTVANSSDFWARCENSDQCSICGHSFSFLNRRHHCRKCYASVCAGCSAHSAALPGFGGNVERVCDRCWPSVESSTFTEVDGVEQASNASEQASS